MQGMLKPSLRNTGWQLSSYPRSHPANLNPAPISAHKAIGPGWHLADSIYQDIPNLPWRSRQREQRLYQLASESGRLFFDMHRPENETYLLLFRKHEQGNNAVELANIGRCWATCSLSCYMKHQGNNGRRPISRKSACKFFIAGPARVQVAIVQLTTQVSPLLNSLFRSPAPRAAMALSIWACICVSNVGD